MPSKRQESTVVELVGEAPSAEADCAFDALSGSGKKVREVLGDLSWLAMSNLLRSPQPRGKKGSKFDAEGARAEADRRKTEGELPRILLLAGKRVAAAFGVPKTVEFFKPCMVRRSICFVVPHPSGVSRWWNSPDNRSLARSFFEMLRGEVVSGREDFLFPIWKAAAQSQGRVYW